MLAGALRAVCRAAGIAAGSAGSFRLDDALHTRSLVMERLLTRGGRRVLGKEVITAARLYACGSACFAARMQAFTRRDDRQVRRHYAGFTQLMFFYAMTPALMPATAKVGG